MSIVVDYINATVFSRTIFINFRIGNYQTMKKTFEFLKKLKKNNDRDWFNANKEEYKAADAEFKDFVNALKNEIAVHDLVDKPKIYRIYRDVRFSPDKTPYKTTRSCSFQRLGEALRGGYYLQVQPGGGSFLAGGFWQPNSQDLLHIRKQIEQEPELLREIVSDKAFKSYFGELVGDQVKTSPKGFSQDSEAIELIRYKQFLVTHEFTDKAVLADDFAQKVSEGFARMRPFFNYMSEILTTDLNGVPLLDNR